MKHGTGNGYKKHGCRCEDCTRANAAEVRTQRDRRTATAVPASDGRAYVQAAPHGTAGGYTNHGCRCDRCTAAATEARLASKARAAQYRRRS